MAKYAPTRVEGEPAPKPRDACMPEPIRLVGAREVQDLFEVGRVRSYQITRRHDFPQPVAELGSGRVWLAEDIEAWIETNRPWNSPEIGETL